MKALILGAGLGTRLRPYTEKLPKPLFPIAGKTIIDMLISRLQKAGCEAVMINTHHLGYAIDEFIAGNEYGIPVMTRYESEILGTGGAIKNLADFWDHRPFIVINGDIVTDIDFKAVYEFHLNHNDPATLVLCDDSRFNTVSVTEHGFIRGFNKTGNAKGCRYLTFTGIQVVNAELLNFIPDGVFSTSITAYEKMIMAGKNIRAFIFSGYWQDIGSPERYRDAVVHAIAPEAFRLALSDKSFNICNIESIKLKGDGSDRKWYRLVTDKGSLIMADHGISAKNKVCESEAFVNIGCHLYQKNIPAPKIYFWDTFSGLVFVEDLGDMNLQAFMQENKDFSAYNAVIDELIKMSIYGAQGFNTAWTYQTAYYDAEVILERECRYFVEAFLNKYLGMNYLFEDFEDEFMRLARYTTELGINGFMHRDMQSRNIMVKNSKFYFIDFQGGRIGPIQYDLASLLIDPYAALPLPVQNNLLDYCLKKLSSYIRLDSQQFLKGYAYCALCRNLQMLGAFGYLSRVKGKTYFEQYIPTAVASLKQIIPKEFPHLKELADKELSTLPPFF